MRADAFEVRKTTTIYLPPLRGDFPARVLRHFEAVAHAGRWAHEWAMQHRFTHITWTPMHHDGNVECIECPVCMGIPSGWTDRYTLCSFCLGTGEASSERCRTRSLLRCFGPDDDFDDTAERLRFYRENTQRCFTPTHRKLASIEKYALIGRGILYMVESPVTCARNIDALKEALGPVEIDGQPVTITGVESHAINAPIRVGEPIGLLVKESPQ